MNRLVYKYQLNASLGDRQMVKARGGRVVHFGFQNNEPHVWIEIMPSAPEMEYEFSLVWTGMVIKTPELEHFSSVQNGGLVWHLYKRVGQ